MEEREQKGTEANVAAVPLPYVMDGREYLLSPLTDLDIMELDAWVQSRMVENALIAGRAPGVTEAERDRMYSIALRESVGVTWYSATGGRVMTTTAGIGRMVYQSLKARHPEVTHIEVVKWLRNNAERVNRAREVFDRVNSLPSGSAVSGATQPGEQTT